MAIEFNGSITLADLKKVFPVDIGDGRKHNGRITRYKDGVVTIQLNGEPSALKKEEGKY